MTVAECIKIWLGVYEKMDFRELQTDFIGSNVGSYGIFKSPDRTITPFADGSHLMKEYYYFSARKSITGDSERISNAQVLADLEDWIENKNEKEEYPDLTKAGKLFCTDIRVENSATITEHSENEAIYQITIAIEYEKENETW